jgi:hypothetical protein
MAALKPSVSTVMPRDTQRILRQVQRETVGVIELEGRLAVEPPPSPRSAVASSSRPRPRSSVLRKRVSSSFSVSVISASARVSSG